MAFIGTIRDRIADDLNRTDLSNSIYQAVNKAIRYYSKQIFWFNVDFATIAIASGSDTIDLSGLPLFYQETDTDGFTILENDVKYPLQKIKKAEYDCLDINSTGLPRVYCWIDGVYKIYPKADSSYSLQVNYIKQYADLVNYVDNNDFTNYAEDLITERAISDIYLRKLHEPEMAQFHKTQEIDEYKKLLDFTRQKTATGYLSSEEGF